MKLIATLVLWLACSLAWAQPAAPTGFTVSVRNTFPNASTTGIPAGTVLTNYTGPIVSGECTLSTPNATYDAIDFSACNAVLIRADNITFTRCKFYLAVNGVESDGYSFTVIDSYLEGNDTTTGHSCINCGFDGWNFTLIRVHVNGTNRGAYCMNNCLIRDSYIHGQDLYQPGCGNSCFHASAIRLERYSTLINNHLACDWINIDTLDNDADLGCSATLSGYPDFAPIHHNTVDGNYFPVIAAGGYCTYGGNTTGKPFSTDPLNATYVVFKNNIYERDVNFVYQSVDDPGPHSGNCGYYGSNTAWGTGRTGNEWTNNKWFPDGATVDPSE